MKNATLFLSFLTLFHLSSHAQNALNFDGSTDYVQTNAPGVLGTANRTFEAWVYVSSSAPLSNLCILDYGTNAVGSRNTFMVTGSRALAFFSGGTNANISSNANDVPTDTWTHVAFVLNSGTGYLYVNGVQVGTGNLSTVNTPGGNDNIKLGQRVTGGSIPFYGSIDEVRVWDLARTQTEIQNNMNAELCTGSANLKLYMQMNQGVAGGTNSGLTTVVDYSGNGIAGTLFTFSLSGSTSNWVSGATLAPGLNGSFNSETACNSYTWSANGQTYTSSGNYTHTLSNMAGCDSIASLNLTINSASNVTTNQVACDSFTWNVNGETYYATTTDVENLTNSSGCQYDHTLNITINNSFFSSETVESCGDYVWAVNGQTYSISGVYTEALTTTSGCDSIYELDVTVSQVSVSVTDNGDSTLSATASNGTYQWIDCGNGNMPIAGATGSTFHATANGNYAVILTDGNCSDTSECISVDYLSVEDLEANAFELYPNPTTGSLTISFKDHINGIIQILDATGKVFDIIQLNDKIAQNFEINSEPGVYFIRLNTSTGSTFTKKVVKL